MSLKGYLFTLLALWFLQICQCEVSINTLQILQNAAHYEGKITQEIADALQCEGTGQIFKDFLTGKEELTEKNAQWLLPMLDAWGKFPSGLLTGNVLDPGQFDECVAIGTSANLNEDNVEGNYCGFAVIGNLTKVVIKWSICIPASCTLGVAAIPISENIQFTIQGSQCQVNKVYSHLDWSDGVTLGVLGVLGFVIIVSTLYDFKLHYENKKSPGPLATAFSLVTNTKKLFATSNSPGQVGSLHGIRAISLMWIIAGHRYVTQGATPSINFVQAAEFKQGEESAYISSGRAAVDTFFLFSAFLVSFIYFKGVRSAIAKAEAKGSKRADNPLTWAMIPMFYIHRILRIIPALAAVYFIQITVFRRIGEGPLWPIVLEQYEPCTEYWWSFFLFVQNYVNYKHICITPTWYLAVDMQLYLLSPFVIIPLGELIIKGKKKLAYILMCVIIAVSIIVPMTVEFFREFDKDNIYETHHRAGVYTMGLLFGMIVVDCNNKKIKINKFLNIFLWGAAIATMEAIVFTMHDTEIYPTLEKNNIYLSLTRPAWSLAVCWVVFACHFGYGGPINWFLTLPIFQIMTKLSFSMYLLHNLMITMSVGNSKTPAHFSEYETMYNWCGDYLFTIVASIVWVLCFESPVVGIEKTIFGTGHRSAEKPPVASNNQSPPEIKAEEGAITKSD